MARNGLMGAVSGLTLGAALLWTASANAGTMDTRNVGIDDDITVATVAPDETPLVLAATDGAVPLNQILEMEPGHLLALGGGVIAGAAVVGPYLGVSELVGVVIGVIGGELFYRSAYWPLRKPGGWLPGS